MAGKKLEVVITGDTKGAQRAMGSLESRSGVFASKMNKVGAGVRSTFSSLGKVGVQALKGIAIASVATGIAVTAALASTINDASNQAEAVSKVQQVFGPASQQVMAWAATSAEAFGQSKTAALEAVGTYGNLFRSFGIGAGKSQEMSQSLVELASDLASFNNTSVDDAIQALRSGLTGETEPLKRYGIAIDEATLKAKAFSMGLIDAEVDVTKVDAALLSQEKAVTAAAAATKKFGADSLEARTAQNKMETATAALAKVMKGKIPAALTPAQKAQASYALILERSKIASGDFARTSDGLANKQRILSAKFADLKAKIGSGLLPIVLKLASVGEKYLMPVLESGAATVSRLAAEMSGPASRAFREVSDGVRAFADAFRSGSEDIQGSGLAGWLGQIGRHARNAFDVMARNWDTVRNAFVTGGKAVGAALVRVYDALRPIVQAIARFVQANPGPVFTALGVVIGGALLSATIAWATAMIAALSPVYLIIAAVAALAGGLVWAYQNVDWFRDAVDKASAYITGTAIPALQRFWAWFSEKILPVLKAVVSFYATAWVAAIKGYIAYIGFMVDKARILWGFFSRNILPIFVQVAGHLAGHFRTSVAVASAVVQTLAAKASALWQRIKPLREALASFASFMASTFRNNLALGRGALQWVVDKARALVSLLKRVVGAAKDAGEAVKSLPSKIPGSGTVSNIIGGIPGFATGGSPPVGQPYLVGENGPEIRIDKRPGTIIPNDRIAMPARGPAAASAAGGGGVTYVTNINAPVYGIDDLANKIELIQTKRVRRNGRSDLFQAVAKVYQP